MRHVLAIRTDAPSFEASLERIYMPADRKPVLSNLFDPAGRTRHSQEAAGRTSKVKNNDKNLLNIDILYLCNYNLLKSEVVHNVCTRYFRQILPLLCHKLSKISDHVPLCMSHFLSTNYE